MSPYDGNDVQTAQRLARQAEELIGKMKVGGWESIQALALTSIANSLAAIASHQPTDPSSHQP